LAGIGHTGILVSQFTGQQQLSLGVGPVDWLFLAGLVSSDRFLERFLVPIRLAYFRGLRLQDHVTTRLQSPQCWADSYREARVTLARVDIRPHR
jgi:hypothetical protein